MDSFIFLNVTSNYPHQFTAGNTKMEYMAKGLLEQECSVIALNSSSSTTIENKDLFGTSTQGIEYITLNSH